MIKKILIGLAVIIVGIIVVSRFQRDNYTVERTGTIAAPPSVVFAQITDFHNWEKFNPWRDLDTNMVLTYEGAPRGVGAKYNWAGNSDAGKGSMTILETTPGQYAKLEMHFVEPMDSKAITEFKFAPEGNGTKLTWSMSGDHNFFSKIICLFMSMENMIGSQYEKGFERMNTAFTGLSENKPSVPIEIVREFDAPREAVWRSWTEPAAFMAWWGGVYSCPAAKLDPKVGGTYHAAMRSPEGQTFWSTGTYKEVVPMEKLVFSDSFADSTGKVMPASALGIPGDWPLELTCSLSFSEANGKTRMVLRHEGVPGSDTEMCTMGWNQSFDKLATSLTSKN